MLAAGGLVALPAWASEWTPDNLPAFVSPFTPAELSMLSSVADTIIPAGNSIGALSVGVDKFLEKLFADCYSADVQQSIKTQLSSLDKLTQIQTGKSFTESSQKERQQILNGLLNSDKKTEKDFFNLLKSETIRGFNTSKEVMQKYLNYKVAPGHYYGCVDTTT
jgi:hypothetical protein